jgi:hypothetical protein
MKKILFIGFILVFLMASFSYAEDQCKIIGELAETIMKKRQEGVDLTTMLNIAGSEGTSEAVANVSRKLVIIAYGHPEYSTEEYKQRAIRKFKTEVMIECYKSE